ncbi:MAG: hypothetical protein AUJ23_04120 [Candidatus Magasanikbacteria bacterium CG1_02_32_51]|uniref:Uncharacterized protein n=1 Tax=Candidatus Magasanikbacteria bacterium CG1_02_32_51 TaxID=1805238 RepID=A0A1J4U4J0_9BACT|nr:MAG: hypothetical protein AUJ23_04120 [Candidatus Magasanikbacteria bacterium CG1_02_32_51]
MPKKNIVKTKIRKAPRKCVICAKYGHNSRTCPALRIAKKESKEVKSSLYGSSFVDVKVVNKAQKSPFVVDISNKRKKEFNLEKINVYKNEQKKPAMRMMIDFGTLIKEENNKRSILQIKNPIVKEKPLLEIVNNQKENKKILSPKFKITKHYRLVPRFYIIKKIILNSKKIVSDFVEFVSEKIKYLGKIFYDFWCGFNFRRFFVSFLVLIIIGTIPFPAVGYYKKIKADTNEVISRSSDAFLALQSSTVSAFNNDIPAAENDLNLALSSFGSAEEIIDKEYKAMLYVAKLLPIVGDKVKSRQDLLLAGHQLALGNAYLVKGIAEATKSETTDNLITRLGILQQHLRGALQAYNIALDQIADVEITAVPVEFQQSFVDFKTLFAGFVNDMNNYDQVIRGIQLIMGGDGFKRYLILFQNTFEIRPTGGFMGSYAVIDVNNGNITNIDIPGEGSYAFQGQLDVYEKPPLPLQLVNKRWEFQDSNWFPDFKASAKKIAWFYEHGKKTTVDGVIAINSSVLERLLTVIGPLQNEDYNILLQSEDALAKLESEVRDYDNKEENTPKKILSVVLSQIFSSVQNLKSSQLVGLVTQLHEALSNREIQLYFNDFYVQNILQDYGWTGEILPIKETQDYLLVVNSNIGGGKSDAQITQKIEHQAVVQEDGSVIDTVIVTRKHIGQGEIYYDIPNIDYLRLYVPAGAELLDAGGFVFPNENSFKVPPSWYQNDKDLENIEQNLQLDPKTGTRITKEFGKTVFGNWMVTKVNSESQIYFIYKLPFNVLSDTKLVTQVLADKKFFDFSNFFSQKNQEFLLSHYSILLQKQSGIESILDHSIIYPDGWVPVWKEGNNLELSVNGGFVEENFDNDKIFGIVMEKK